MRSATEERCFHALKLRAEGLTYREIGERIGHINDAERPVSTARARQIVFKGKRLLASRAEGNG